MERNRPFTMNHNGYGVATEEFVIEFAHARAQGYTTLKSSSSSTHTIKDIYGTSHSITAKGVGEDVLLSLLVANGYHVSSAKQLARLHDPDFYETELEVISQVLAYFQIASRRIIDVMPMIFETVFARDFGDEIQKELTSSLKLVGDFGLENCAKFAREEREVQVKREDLNKRKEILSRAVMVVHQFYE